MTSQSCPQNIHSEETNNFIHQEAVQFIQNLHLNQNVDIFILQASQDSEPPAFKSYTHSNNALFTGKFVGETFVCCKYYDEKNPENAKFMNASLQEYHEIMSIKEQFDKMKSSAKMDLANIMVEDVRLTSESHSNLKTKSISKTKKAKCLESRRKDEMQKREELIHRIDKIKQIYPCVDNIQPLFVYQGFI